MCDKPALDGKPTCGSKSCQNGYGSTKRPNSLMRPKEHWLSMTFDGRYRLVDSGLPKWFGPKSNIRVRLTSDVGHVRDINWRVLYYAKKSFIHPERGSDLIGRRFGSLTVVRSPDWYYANSSKTTVEVVCECGNKTSKQIAWLTSGDTSTCGECDHKSWKEWCSQKYHKLAIIDSEHNQRLSQMLPPKFGAHVSKGVKVDVRCECGNTNRTRLDGLLSFSTLSCGCALNENTSGPEREINAFVRSLGVETVPQYRVAKHRLIDVFIPSVNLGIEHHGCFWHSEARRSPEGRLKDHEKFVECQRLGVELIQIYGDEWIQKRPIFEDMIRKRVGIRGVRISKLTCELIQKRECDAFLESNHYIGKADGSIRLGIFSRGKLVGASVIKEHASHLECTRFCMRIGLRSYQPFAKVIAWLSEKFKGTILTSFSDNRLHTGKSYLTLGFKHVSDVPPDYCYTNGVRRSHKFNFRVPAGINEQTEAARLNYFRLWDSGKKKWELIL